jgi:spermidine synthase
MAHATRRSGLSLAALVFGAGIGALATEITASRLLAPYFGSSTIVWANLIGIVLAALALGYWLGGRIADRRPEPPLLGFIVLAAAVCVAAIPFVAEPFLELTVEGLDEASAGAVVGSFVAVLLLCAPPVVLLGMVSPFAIRLAVSSIETAGAVAGRLYALSTAGSLLGTFLPALVLIPAIGTQRTFLVVAALLALSSCFLLGARYLVVAALLAALVAIPPGAVKGHEGLLHEETSYHQYIQVVEEDDGRRLLYLNEGIAVHSVWRPDTVLTGGVWDAFLVVPLLLDRPLERVAILGNAAGTTSRGLASFYPQVQIDGVELDPAVSRVGRKYFGLAKYEGETVHDADARPFLRSTDERYDLIVVDAYHQPYVPFYLATREFFELARERLRPGGIVALNVAAVPDDKRLVRAIGTTMAAELPQVLEWPALRFNTVVLGLTEALAPEEIQRRLAVPLAELELDRRLHHGSEELEPLRKLLARDLRPLEPSGRAWTDDHAPVEWLTDRMIISYAAEGGRLDEDYLPTRPAPRTP